MLIKDFNYELPAELIAQHPAERRDESRLMLLRRHSGGIEHHRFRDLPRLLGPDDLLVLNNTRVFPARLFALKRGGEARIEVFLLRAVDGEVWEALLRPARRARVGTRLIFKEGEFEGEVLESLPDGKRLIRLEAEKALSEWIEKVGQIPLPPYIHRPGGVGDPADRERYQTIYAKDSGSVAAPTAGLHFTPELLAQLCTCEVTLHVGYGTFKPVQAERVEDHRMEEEYFTIEPAAAAAMEGIRRRSSGRIIAVGTTTTRALESAASRHGKPAASSGWTDLFIYPGYRFEAIDGLITNFHLPGSTLLLLVAALAGKELIRTAYETAIEEQYRFYSYGDAMLIL